MQHSFCVKSMWSGFPFTWKVWTYQSNGYDMQWTFLNDKILYFKYKNIDPALYLNYYTHTMQRQVDWIYILLANWDKIIKFEWMPGVLLQRRKPDRFTCFAIVYGSWLQFYVFIQIDKFHSNCVVKMNGDRECWVCVCFFCDNLRFNWISHTHSESAVESTSIYRTLLSGSIWSRKNWLAN